jgi:hypothetical protein
VTRKLLFVVLTVVAIAIALFAPRIEQNQAYHRFADTRTVLGVRNGLNVLSNLAFLVVGAWGLRVALRGARFSDPRERPPWAALFMGVLLTAPGSAWYHLDPNDASLVWDRLPMSVGFMGLFAALIGERVSVDWGVRLLPPLLAAGAASVAWWAWDGNLVPYYVVQFYPLLAILLLLALFPPPYTMGGDLLIALALYVAAKQVETYDRPIHEALGFVSGHTLKHLLAAAGAAWLAAMLLRRRPVPPVTA